MKQIYRLVGILFCLMILSGCLASTTSPDGISCDGSDGKPVWERPLVCQGR